jgi:anti-sigma B factor antagonist
MAQFEAKVTDEDGVLRVTLAGECDLAVSEQLSDALLAAVRRAPLVIVDLAGLAFLDSSGVHSLVSAHHVARERGSRLVVVNPVGAVATVLDLTGVGALLSMDPNGTRPRPAAPGSGQGSGHGGSGQPGSGQPCSGQPGSGQLGSGQPGSGQPCSAQPHPAQPHPGQAQPAQAHPGHVHPGQVPPRGGDHGEIAGQP